MGNITLHVSVCILTYKRPVFLSRLLERLQSQRTDNSFTYSIVVIDNDSNESARETVGSMQKASTVPILYDVEHQQNLSIARNRAIERSEGDFVAYIDDDEFPVDDWLEKLVMSCEEYDAAGVLGPVVPHFEDEPPKWIVKSAVFDRPRYPTGTVLRWNQTRTGNTLLRRSLFSDSTNFFDPAFGAHGEDRDLFRRLMEKGNTFIWCDEAIVYETQPRKRLTRGYLLRRALVRGSVAHAHTPKSPIAIGKSVLAVMIYAPSLLILQLAGHHWFMKYLIKSCDHVGRILAFTGYPVEHRISLS